MTKQETFLTVRYRESSACKWPKPEIWNAMTTRLRRPKPVDLQRALAFITASIRNDGAITTIWDAAVEDGRELMLALALTTLAKQPQMMTDLLAHPATAIVNLSRVTEAFASLGADGPDDEEDDDWYDGEEAYPR